MLSYFKSCNALASIAVTLVLRTLHDLQNCPKVVTQGFLIRFMSRFRVDICEVRPRTLREAIQGPEMAITKPKRLPLHTHISVLCM